MICRDTRSVYRHSEESIADKSRSILIPRFTVLCEALASGYQTDSAMSVALDELIRDVFASAVETVGNSALESVTREDYAKLVVRLLNYSVQPLAKDEQIRSVSGPISLTGVKLDS
jgi:hypothetical protein